MNPRIRQLRYLLLALIVGIICAQAAHGIEFAESSFVADTLQVLPDGRYALSMAFPEAAHVAYDHFAYVSSMINWGVRTGAIHVMAEDGTFTPQGGGAPDTPMFIQFSNAAFGNRLFCADAGHPDSWTDGVYSVSPEGASELLTALGGGNPNPHDMAFGSGGAFGNWMYVAMPDDGSANPGYRRAIVRIDPSGSYGGQLCTHPYGPSRLTFSTGGAFGEYLYFNCYSDSRNIYRVNAVGIVEVFAQSSDNIYIIGFARGGAFGTDLYVRKSDGIFRVTGAGDIIAFASNVAVGASAFDPTSGDLYIFSGGDGPLVRIYGRWPTPVPDALPQVLKLHPCQPNPFNPQTTVKYDLPESGPVRLTVFDVAGRLVRTLVDDSMPQGSHEAVWDGRDASGREVGSGSYVARLEFGGRVETVRLALVR